MNQPKQTEWKKYIMSPFQHCRMNEDFITTSHRHSDSLCVSPRHTEFLHSEDSVVSQLNKEETYTQIQDGRHPTAEPHNASERSGCPLHPVRWDTRCWHHSRAGWHHNRHDWQQTTAASQEELSFMSSHSCPAECRYKCLKKVMFWELKKEKLWSSGFIVTIGREVIWFSNCFQSATFD